MNAATSSDNAQAKSAANSVQKKRSFLAKIFGALIFSLVVSILLEWIGIAFYWPEEGQYHSELMVEKELGYLNEDFKEGVFDSNPALLIGEYSADAYYYLFQFTYIENGISWLGEALGVATYASAALNSIQVLLIRLGILIFSLPVYVLFAVVGASSGLSLRDIRRWSGGREYGRVYHQAKALAPKALVLAWIVYLTMPESVHPNFIILPCAILFGLNILIMTATYKKYI